jgi:DNA mismatch endonuclease (patch repair protein)
VADIVDRQTRSRMMAGIRGKHTKPELAVRRFLHRIGFRFRLHDRNLPGKPDLVFPKYRAVVHVHGCFWHQHAGCRFAYTPASNRDFWQTKLRQNVARDAKNDRALHELGWRSITVWECEVADSRALENLSKMIRRQR